MTKTINLRNLPEDVVRRAKIYAVFHGMTLKDFVVMAITKAIEAGIPAMPKTSALLLGGSSKEKRRLPPSLPRRLKPRRWR